jgi:hypothetical protein
MAANQAASKVHRQLSELIDEVQSIYDMTKDLARISKQIKEDTKEDIDPPAPVLEAIDIAHEKLILEK